jgi:hypothetical protein
MVVIYNYSTDILQIKLDFYFQKLLILKLFDVFWQGVPYQIFQ